jgi:hypothetical protein
MRVTRSTERRVVLTGRQKVLGGVVGRIWACSTPHQGRLFCRSEHARRGDESDETRQKSL